MRLQDAANRQAYGCPRRGHRANRLRDLVQYNDGFATNPIVAAARLPMHVEPKSIMQTCASAFLAFSGRSRLLAAHACRWCVSWRPPRSVRRRQTPH